MFLGLEVCGRLTYLLYRHWLYSGTGVSGAGGLGSTTRLGFNNTGPDSARGAGSGLSSSSRLGFRGTRLGRGGWLGLGLCGTRKGLWFCGARRGPWFCGANRRGPWFYGTRRGLGPCCTRRGLRFCSTGLCSGLGVRRRRLGLSAWFGVRGARLGLDIGLVVDRTGIGVCGARLGLRSTTLGFRIHWDCVRIVSEGRLEHCPAQTRSLKCGLGPQYTPPQASGTYELMTNIFRRLHFPFDHAGHMEFASTGSGVRCRRSYQMSSTSGNDNHRVGWAQVKRTVTSVSAR